MLLLPGVASMAVTFYPAWDESLFRTLNLAGTNLILDLIMVFFTSLALPYILPLLALPLWWTGHRERAVDLLVVLLLVIVITEIIKFAVDRTRPCQVLPNVHLVTPDACIAEAGDPSFPSGHASRVFAVAAFLAVYFRWPTKALAFGTAILAGISRIYLGVHWPSDVLAGAAVGMAVAWAFVVIARHWRFYPTFRSRVIGLVDRLLPKQTKPT